MRSLKSALEGIPEEARMILVATFATLAVLLVLTHRWWPEACRKADLAFAGDHYVEDTHAKRIARFAQRGVDPKAKLPGRPGKAEFELRGNGLRPTPLLQNGVIAALYMNTAVLYTLA